jgi:hypothetical protein
LPQWGTGKLHRGVWQTCVESARAPHHHAYGKVEPPRFPRTRRNVAVAAALLSELPESRIHVSSKFSVDLARKPQPWLHLGLGGPGKDFRRKFPRQVRPPRKLTEL